MEHFCARKFITAMLFVENARKHYYVTNEIMKRWYLFDIVLSLVDYVFCYIKTSVFLSIFSCFYIFGDQICFVVGENLRKQVLPKISMLLIREKESQIQDLWNGESKSNIKIWWWLVNLSQNLCETLCRR